jgi:hypothetical protein
MPGVGGEHSHIMSTLINWLAVLLVVVAVGAGAWFGYTRLTTPTTDTPTSTTPIAVVPVASLTPGSGDLGVLAPLLGGVHTSALAKPAGFTATFPAIAKRGVLKTRFQLIQEGLAQIPATTKTAELVPTDADGKALSFPGYATTIGARDLMDAKAYADYLRDDFSLFVVRGPGGFSAAYVLTLKEGASWLYAAPGIRTIEQAPHLGSLFLQLAGTRSDSFTDGTVNNQPTRTATYTEPAGTLTYGFFGNHLVIATSQQALEEVLRLL